MPEFTPQDPTAMEYTRAAEDIKALVISNEQGNPRQIIGRDTEVLNGVYGGDYAGEAIVVDYDEHPGMYDYLTYSVVEASKEVDETGEKKLRKDLILNSVLDVTRARMKYSQGTVDEIFQTEGGGVDLAPIPLSTYMKRKAGVCRHQALLATALLQRLNHQGFVRGQASVERSVQWPENGDPAGHSWVRYTNNSGQIFILDPAQNFIGSLAEAAERPRGWNYMRTEEDREVRAAKVADQVAETAITDSGIIQGIPDHLKPSDTGKMPATNPYIAAHAAHERFMLRTRPIN